MSVRPIVEVTWFDAQTSIESLYVDEIKKHLKPCLSKSVGYLIHENKEFIVLGFLDFGDGLIKHHQVIPLSIIKDKKIIRDGSKID